MTKLERDLLGTLKACVQVLENHARHLNSNERRQLRRAWLLIEREEGVEAAAKAASDIVQRKVDELRDRLDPRDHALVAAIFGVAIKRDT